MSRTKKQFIISLSFVLILLGLGLWATTLSRKTTIENLAINYLDVPQENIEESPSLISLMHKMAGYEKEMSYLVLFQNNLELRPTGGFVSSFATAKIGNARPKDFQFYCTAVFDLELSTPTKVEPPKPIKDYLWVKNWQFRDGNWSPDFPTAAQKMIDFYHIQGGEEEFDGVIAITTEVLRSLLSLYGPIELEEYNLTIDEDNFLLTLEKQVEVDYREQGIPRFERKDILMDLAEILMEKTLSLNPLKSLRLISIAKDHLAKKDILLYFNDPELQQDVVNFDWSGEIKSAASDYIYAVDANVNAFKADLYVKRGIEYHIDLTQDKPKAKLIINYNHTAQEKSWLTRDYQSWLRFYVPQGSWFTNIEGLSTEPQYGEEFGKTFMAGLVKVPISSTHQVVLEYDLPEIIKDVPYSLLIQKQPGIIELPVNISVTRPNGKIKTFKETIETDTEFEL